MFQVCPFFRGAAGCSQAHAHSVYYTLCDPNHAAPGCRRAGATLGEHVLLPAWSADFPRVSPAVSARPHRYVYAAAAGTQRASFPFQVQPTLAFDCDRVIML